MKWYEDPVYIKQCEKAREIQERWKNCDLRMLPSFIYDTKLERVALAIWLPSILADRINPGSNTMVVSVEWDRDRRLYIPPGKYSIEDGTIWLPDQSQLQDMVIDKPDEMGYNYITFWLIHRFWNFIGEEKPIHHHGKIRSMEQLWLAFDMKELYSKVWDTTKEDWVKC